MKKLIFIFSIILLLSGCGSSNTSTVQHAPSIHELEVWPLFGATGDTFNPTLYLFFIDLDKNLSTLHINWSNTLGASGSFSEDISNPLNSGNIEIPISVDMSAVTIYTFEAYAVDTTGLASGTLTTTFIVQLPIP